MIRHIYTVTFLLIAGLLLQSYGSSLSSQVTYTPMAAASARVDSTVLGEVYNRAQTLHRFGKSIRGKRQAEEDINANKTTVIEDHHDYYTSRFISSSEESSNYWFELGTLIGSGAMLQDDVIESIIQGFHRYYEVWDLKFNFQFYGHFINRVAVTTGGFLYTGTFFHSQLHLTQLIAPLQADFNPTIANDSRILIYSTEERFTAQWDGVHNHDHNDAGPFTFQVTLFQNGSIHFVYREIPLPVSEINNDDHPVEVGLADAFYYDIFQGFFRIRYVYEYSRIKLNASNNLAYTAYIIDPLPNCVQGSTCAECTNLTKISSFDCEWCPVTNRCSDGLDRHTQDWVDNDCERQARSFCSSRPPSPSSSSTIRSSIETTSTLSSSSSLFISTTVETIPTTSSTFISTASVETVPTTPSSSISTASVETILTTSSSSISTTVETIPTTSSSFISTTVETIPTTSSTSISTTVETIPTTPSSSISIASVETIPTTSSLSSINTAVETIPPTSSSISTAVHIPSSSSLSLPSDPFLTRSVSSASAAETTPSPVIRHASSSTSPGVISAIVLVLLVVTAVLVVLSVAVCILVYGHKRPTSKIGLFLIEHRPKARSLNRTAKYDLKTDKVLLN